MFMKERDWKDWRAIPSSARQQKADDGLVEIGNISKLTKMA
jgi:hypothetical protein